LPKVSGVDDERRRIAVHEAGHVVIANSVGIPLHVVTIVETENYAGLTTHSLAWIDRLRASFEGPEQDDEREPVDPSVLAMNGIMVCLAGRLAESVLLGSESHPSRYEHDESGITDLVGRFISGGPCCLAFDERFNAEIMTLTERTPDAIGKVLESLRCEVHGHGWPGVAEADAYVAWLTIRTRRLVTAKRADIEKVADALVARSTLSADEVEAILEADLRASLAASRARRRKKTS